MKMAAHGYQTRGKRVDYRELNKVVLPRATREKKSRLYSVEIVERNVLAGKVKIHYVGYSSSDDEWRDAADVVDLCEAQPSYLISPSFSLYQELALMIKASLQSSRKESPEVKITMNFDKVQFDGGIRQLEKLKSDERGIKKYTIDCYSDWTPF